MKRFIALATLAALAAATGPALAVTTKTSTVTVKWNTQAIASLTLHTDYNGGTGAFNGGTQAGQILLGANGGSGTCTAVDPTNTDLTVDFGTPSPDSAQFTDCLYQNAVNMAIATNSINWNLGVAATAGYVAANGTLCGYANTVAGTFPVANSAVLGVHGTARVAAVANTVAGACAASYGPGPVLMDAAGTTTNLVNGNTHAFTAASPANVGMDIELALANNAPTGTTTVTETYTLTAN